MRKAVRFIWFPKNRQEFKFNAKPLKGERGHGDMKWKLYPYLK
jgi:hypothetical protein